jgi:hypothetical protein
LCACKHKVSGSFHSPPGVLFTFPSRYCSSIGHQVIFRLGWWSTRLPTAIPRVPRYSGYSSSTSDFRYRALTFCGRPSHAVLLSSASGPLSSTPQVLLLTVWPLARSLATTYAISFDFSSSPYLDVSVQAVPHVHLWIQCTLPQHDLRRVSPFGYLRIKAYLRLPVAFRSLSRPSSVPGAKAFPLRSF